MYADDTIAAIATPAGPGGVGIIRVSGLDSPRIATAVFAGDRSAEWESHRLHHGHIIDTAGVVIDEGLAVLMYRPHSYTGEDVLELHCHGSPVVLRRVLATVLSCGARLAEPGEFTKRAFLNGKLDLAQAEAVIDLVRARSDAGAAAAAGQLTGQLSGSLAAARQQLIRLKALLEAQIDFAEEDVAVVPGTLLALLDDSQEVIDRLINTYKYGRLLRNGVRIAIVGKPNVGKSSLLNALLGEDRALVTPIAGTTRDTIEETADFDGVPVVLTDTAGLRPDAGDVVERLGMARTTATISGAQLLLTVFDASRPLDSDDHAVLKAASGVRQLVVLNKTDLGVALADNEVARLAREHAVVEVSAKERRGLNELRYNVMQMIGDGGQRIDGEPVLTNLRHHAALVSARQSLDLAHGSICDCRPPDLVAVDVQDALDRIGEITGTITSEDVLESIFSEFCIGK